MDRHLHFLSHYSFLDTRRHLRKDKEHEGISISEH